MVLGIAKTLQSRNVDRLRRRNRSRRKNRYDCWEDTHSVFVHIRNDWFLLQTGPASFGALQQGVGVDDGTRTHDDRDHNPGLYQLSYAHH